MFTKSFFRVKHLPWQLCLALLFTILIAGCTSTKVVSQKHHRQNYAFWPAYPDKPRVQFLTAYQYSSDVEPVRSSFDKMVYGNQSQKVLPIQKPYGVEMYDGKIYVCDFRSSSVTVLDIKKKQTRLMGTRGMKVLKKPVDIAIADDGMMYVADIGHNLIFVFDQKERYVTEFGHKKFKPVSVAVHGNELYVSDFANQHIEVLDRQTGEVKRTFGQSGKDKNKFVRPLGIDVDKQGNSYVTDVMLGRLQKRDPDGKVLLNIGKIGDTLGSFIRPKHVAVDREGMIYVVDASFQNVQLFTPKGKLAMFFGSAGKHPGAMFLPAGICVHEGDVDLFAEYIHPAFDAKYLIIVTNQFGPHKVAVYAAGQLKPGKTAKDIRASRIDITLGVSAKANITQKPANQTAEPKAATPTTPTTKK